MARDALALDKRDVTALAELFVSDVRVGDGRVGRGAWSIAGRSTRWAYRTGASLPESWPSWREFWGKGSRPRWAEGGAARRARRPTRAAITA